MESSILAGLIVVLLAGLAYRLIMGARAGNMIQVISCAAVLLLFLLSESRRHFPGHDLAILAAQLGVAAACVSLKLRVERRKR